jgi:hypothetical protein
VVLAVCPDVLDRVQFRCIGWQILHLQSAFLVADELLSETAPMARKPVPNHQDVALDVTEQVFQKLDNLFGLDGALDLEIEIPVGQTGDHRKSFPVEMKLEDGRLAARRPGAPPMGPLAQTAFVDEDNGAAFFFSFFLISGQRRCCQSSIRTSFRSNARPTGCCTLQFSCRRTRHTCPG